MSRAFVKETDADIPDDLPELPLSAHPNYVTTQGLGLLRERSADAGRRLAEIAPDAVGAMLERAMIHREMRWLQARIGSAITVVPVASNRVGFGTTVNVVADDGGEHRYRIVGEDEADPERGLVSWISPLARALDGARVGDSVVWKRPAGDLSIEVVAIV